MKARTSRKVLAASALAATAALLTAAAPAHAGSLPYSYATTFKVPVPADAILNGWCYDQAVVDSKTHLLYLADAANKQITIINPKTSGVSALGTGLFTGIAGCHSFNYDAMGPDGLALYKNDIFAGNGDSHVLGLSIKNGKQIADVNTGGALRADEMTIADDHLIVDNPAEQPHPYISFIKLSGKGKYTIDARYTFTQATGGLEQPQYWDGHLYIAVPQTTTSPGGEVDELDISNLSNIHIIRQFTFATCQPAGLAVRGDGVAAVGCGGPSATSQEILNLVTGQQTPVNGVSGVDIVAVSGPYFLYVSYSIPEFVIADSTGAILQTFPATSASHTVVVDPCNGDVWVPQDAGNVNLYVPTP
jgi:hypothetical protein